MRTHTPGPWQGRKKEGVFWIDTVRKHRKHVKQIADVLHVEVQQGNGDIDWDLEETQANMDLIAASPELLESAEELLQCLGTGLLALDGAQLSACKLLEQAIAKARGKEVSHATAK